MTVVARSVPAPLRVQEEDALPPALAAVAHAVERAKNAFDANDSFALRVVKAGLEVPKAIGWGALGGLVVVALPSVLAPPIAPFFLPWAPVAAVWGGTIGFMNGTVNAVGRLIEGNEFKAKFPPG